MTCSICGEGEYVIKHNESGSMSYTEPVSHLDCVLRLQEENEKLRASLLAIHDSPRGDVVVLQTELAALRAQYDACQKTCLQRDALIDELDELKGRRCDTCKRWRTFQQFDKNEQLASGCPVSFLSYWDWARGRGADDYPPSNFACNRWTARQDGES
jgi:hypothetical protein